MKRSEWNLKAFKMYNYRDVRICLVLVINIRKWVISRENIMNYSKNVFAYEERKLIITIKNAKRARA